MQRPLLRLTGVLMFCLTATLLLARCGDRNPFEAKKKQKDSTGTSTATATELPSDWDGTSDHADPLFEVTDE